MVYSLRFSSSPFSVCSTTNLRNRESRLERTKVSLASTRDNAFSAASAGTVSIRCCIGVFVIVERLLVKPILRRAANQTQLCRSCSPLAHFCSKGQRHIVWMDLRGGA